MTFQPPKSNAAVIFSALKGRRLVVIMALCAVVITNLADFIAPQVVRYTVDSVISNIPFPAWLAPYIDAIGGRDTLRANIWLCGVMVVLAAVISMLFGFIRRYWTTEPGEYVSQQLRNKLYAHVQRLPFAWHVKAQTGDIIQRCTSDVDVVRNFITTVLPDFTRSIIMIIASATIMLTMDPIMTLAGICLMPLFAITGVIYHRVISKTFLDKDESEGALQGAVQENLSGVRVVRAFGRERFEIDRFRKRNLDFFGKSVKMGNGLAAFWGFSDLIGVSQMFLVVLIGVIRCLDGQLTVGTFLVFYTYTEMMIWPARETGRLLSEMAKCSISLGRLREVLAEPPEQDVAEACQAPTNNDIVFDHVTFGYLPHQPVLQDVSFTLKQGQTLGILGGTGSGKSTIGYLLTRLYDVPEGQGRITIGGVDIAKLPRAFVRRHIAMVLQEPFLYSKTIGENIKGARSEAALAHLETVSRVAAIHDTISELDDGYDTKIGERGVTLSGGQKQRVAIARMLLQNAPIMIFDDSLSAVDTQTDAQIRASLKQHTQDATVVLISHRISTLMHADTILVLDNGRVEAMGSHETLLGGDNSYRKVYDMQRAVVESEVTTHG